MLYFTKTATLKWEILVFTGQKPRIELSRKLHCFQQNYLPLVLGGDGLDITDFTITQHWATAPMGTVVQLHSLVEPHASRQDSAARQAY